ADSMTEIPRGFVAHTKHSLNLIRAHALARFTEQIHGSKPLDKRQVGIVKDRVRRDGKLIVALFAIEKVFLSLKRRCLAFTARAFWTHRPAQSLEQFTALCIG